MSITTVVQRASVDPNLKKPRSRRQKTLGDQIVLSLRRDGLLPFSVSLSAQEAIPLAHFLRDIDKAWGGSGALKTCDLRQEPCGNPGGRVAQPCIPTDEMLRAQRVLDALRYHERSIMQWLEQSRSRGGVTLAKAGAEWSGIQHEKTAIGVATGMMKALCRTLSEHYPPEQVYGSDYTRTHPGSEAA